MSTFAGLCSGSSEEGFHSGASSDDSVVAPFAAINSMDRLAYDLGTLAVQQKRMAFGQQKCNSDSGTSSGELEHQGMKDEVGLLRGASTGLVPAAPVESTAANTAVRKMPGAWFYEELYRGDESASPTSEADDLYLAQLLCAARNISENVEVPSSEHVAEIVGRQGCKIKALRAKTNTYIKTPVRGEEPIFVVTGKPEDVMEAKREIECAAEHFTQIRASRRHSQGGAPAPGHVTAYVRVPLRVVGLVVGPKGATIKRIQQDTHTYIITPSREREPIFEVTGLPQNVEAARKEIEQHIYQRTGNMPITDPSASLSHYAAQPAAQQTVAPQHNGNTHDFHTSSLSAAASVATRSSYGSLAQAPNRRVAAVPFDQQFSSDYHQPIRQPMAENYQYNGMNMMRNNYQQVQQHQQKGCYPSAHSPSIFGANGANQQNNGAAPFQPWSNNTYAGLGIQDQNTQQQDLFYSSRTSGALSGANSNVLSGASTWASAFGAVGCQSGADHRDEGLGDSPASAGAENPYRLMSSIWADIEPRDENKQTTLPLLTA